MFPASMLAKLFVKGSLKNTENGFEFRFKNIIDSGTLTGMNPLVVDETAYDLSKTTLKLGDKSIPADQITREHPVTVRAFIEASIQIDATPLTPGEHKVTLSVVTREAGKIAFSVTEPLSGS